jgi:hypothetical protein
MAGRAVANAVRGMVPCSTEHVDRVAPAICRRTTRVYFDGERQASTEPCLDSPGRGGLE